MIRLIYLLLLLTLCANLAAPAPAQDPNESSWQHPAEQSVESPAEPALLQRGSLRLPEQHLADKLLPAGGPEQWTSPEGLTSSLQTVLMLTVLSMAPAILLMTTCYIRIIIVLGLLKQAIGLQTLPPTQVMTSITLFMTLFVMTPVWTKVYDNAIEPYTNPEVEMSLREAYELGSLPIRQFMSRQIKAAHNDDDIFLFYEYMDPDGPLPSNYEDVPIRVLLPAFILSELKVAFLMGFQIYLPFLIVDLVVASVTISMGMLMLPPATISLPFKLLLFVLVDGWTLVVKTLLESFGPIG